MLRFTNIVALAAAAVAIAAGVAAAFTAPLAGTWANLPAPPVAIDQAPTGVWTGRQLILFGRHTVTARDARGATYAIRAFDASAAYDPASNRWRRLAPPAGPGYVPDYRGLWTGRELLAFGAFHSVAYNPATNSWRELQKSINLGFVAWTGREAIGWGGGCCGDVQSNGTAYNPETNAYRNLPPSPLAPSQHALGAWTGRELLLFVSGYRPEGKPYPARFARAAAYNPAKNTWRRLAPSPATGLRMGAAAWDGRELLVVAAGADSRSAFAYNPATNHWRTLAPLPAPRLGPSVAWTGKSLLLVGGQNANATRQLRDGLAYDPRTNHWSTIAPGPLGKPAALALWTGRSLVLGGPGRLAAFTPRA
jgi:N-acetylneuraminic acid mutarotase